MSYSFSEAQNKWKVIPVDHRTYRLDTIESMGDNGLKALMNKAIHSRYNREEYGKERTLFGFDNYRDKIVFDFGCGTGVDSLLFAQSGNQVIAGDINVESLRIVDRVFKVFNQQQNVKTVLITDTYPFFNLPTEVDKVDVFHFNGVLHHIPYARRVMERVYEVLSNSGEVTLLLYTDKAWKNMVNEDPPIGDVENHPKFKEYVQRMDISSNYADWYDYGKLQKLVKNIFIINQWSPGVWMYGDQYAIAKLRRLS